jgi:hypothetical protein
VAENIQPPGERRVVVGASILKYLLRCIAGERIASHRAMTALSGRIGHLNL